MKIIMKRYLIDHNGTTYDIHYWPPSKNSLSRSTVIKKPGHTEIEYDYFRPDDGEFKFIIDQYEIDIKIRKANI